MLAASLDLAVGGRSDGAGWSLFLKISMVSKCTINVLLHTKRAARRWTCSNLLVSDV